MVGVERAGGDGAARPLRAGARDPRARGARRDLGGGAAHGCGRRADRRAKENGSGGTDHGAAGTAFLIGSRAAGRQIGEFPGLGSGLDGDGNLTPTSDFRAVYASLLEQWLGFDAARIIPGAAKLARPTLVK